VTVRDWTLLAIVVVAAIAFLFAVTGGFILTR
jgi:hypothetical protein